MVVILNHLIDTKENPSVIEGSFVELDPNNENDLDTMCNLNEHWGFFFP